MESVFRKLSYHSGEALWAPSILKRENLVIPRVSMEGVFAHGTEETSYSPVAR